MRVLLTYDSDTLQLKSNCGVGRGRKPVFEFRFMSMPNALRIT